MCPRPVLPCGARMSAPISLVPVRVHTRQVPVRVQFSTLLLILAQGSYRALFMAWATLITKFNPDARQLLSSTVRVNFSILLLIMPTASIRARRQPGPVFNNKVLNSVWTVLVMSVSTGQYWSCLAWSGHVWSCLYWSGPYWSVLVWYWSVLVWACLAWSVLVWSCLVRSGQVS